MGDQQQQGQEPQGQAQEQPQAPAYTPPATQADLDRMIGERVARERGKFADYADLKAKATQFDELAEAQKTELQKAQERADAAERKAAELESAAQIAAWKAEVSKETGIPAAALAGATKEEIEAHAETLKPLIAPPQQQRPQAPTDGYLPALGTASSPLPQNATLAEQIAAAQSAGEKALVSTLKAIQLGGAK